MALAVVAEAVVGAASRFVVSGQYNVNVTRLDRSSLLIDVVAQQRAASGHHREAAELAKGDLAQGWCSSRPPCRPASPR